MTLGAIASAPPSPRQADVELETTTIRRVSLRLLPFLFALYICNWIDRENVGIAALQMNRDLGLSATAYGFGAGIFFLGYVLFEVPSNLILARVGARKWIARIMISWGLIASALMFVRTPMQFYALRLLLGVAEAGFFPGIIYYLSQWFPTAERGRAISRFMIAVPLAGVVGNPLGAMLLGLNGRFGLHGWQWLFLIEGIPSVLLGIVTIAFLTDRIEDARWLSDEQRTWLAARVRQDQDESAATHNLSALRALVHPTVWLLALPYLLIQTASYGYVFWAPTIVRDALHSTNVVTGLITGAIAFMAAAAMLVCATSSDRTGERCLHAAVPSLLGAVGYVGAALLPSPIARVASLALAWMGMRAFIAPFWCMPSMLLRGSAAAVGIAFVNSIGNVGGFVGPYLIGVFKDATGGTTGVFLVLAAMTLIGAALFLVVRRQPAFASRATRRGEGAAIKLAAAAGNA